MNALTDFIAEDLAAFRAFNQAQQAQAAGISYILDLVRSDGKKLIGGDSPRDPGLVAVYGKQPIKRIVEIFTAVQGKPEVTLAIANMVDYTTVPQKTIEGAANVQAYMSKLAR